MEAAESYEMVSIYQIRWQQIAGDDKVYFSTFLTCEPEGHFHQVTISTEQHQFDISTYTVLPVRRYERNSVS
jgi:hypothetical protein